VPEYVPSIEFPDGPCTEVCLYFLRFKQSLGQKFEGSYVYCLRDICQQMNQAKGDTVATHFACRHGSGFFLSYMAEFWDNEWRVQRVGACHSFFTRGKAKERTPWPASLVRSFSRSYNPDDYTERTAICREIYGDFQGCLPRRIPTCGLPTLQLAG